MVGVTPAIFDELRTYGFATAVPDSRRMPGIASAVLLDPQRERVYFPPFALADDLLSEVGDDMSLADFEELVERGYATKLCGAPARSDGCFFFPAGGGAPEYTSLTSAASRLAEFANDMAARGDRLLRKGQREAALAVYELAAATSQAPDHYARMLLVPLSPRRRTRIMEALGQVATLDPPERHIHRMRARLGRELPVAERRNRPSSGSSKARLGPSGRTPKNKKKTTKKKTTKKKTTRTR